MKRKTLKLTLALAAVALSLSSLQVCAFAAPDYTLSHDDITMSGESAAITTPSPLVKNVLEGKINGLTILIDFPDSKRTVSKTEIKNALNLEGYGNNGNNGSVRDYFFDVSGGKVTYTNTVTKYYRAKKSKSYYDNKEKTDTPKIHELIEDAINDLVEDDFDFSKITKDDNGNIQCLNILYAGESIWDKGLWPHKSDIWKEFAGVKIGKYVICDIESTFSIGTFVHESGHLLCGWPDTYDKDDGEGESKGAGYYDLMSSNFELFSDDSNTIPNYYAKNPPLPNPYFRNILSGWGNIVRLPKDTSPTQYSVAANSIDSIIYETSNRDEFFMIENAKKTGRRNNAPDEGILIWHIDAGKYSNDYQEMEPGKHYMVSVEQADGMFHLENNLDGGGDGDLFHAGYVSIFGPKASNDEASSNMWNGSLSGLNITNISDVGDVMTFTYTYFDPLKPIPANLRYTSQTPDAVNLQWDGSTEITGIYLFCVYVDITSPDGVTTRDIVHTKNNSFTAPTRPGYMYTYVVTAIDSSGNEFGTTNKLYISGDGKDIQKPTVPTNIKVNKKGNTVDFSWDTATDIVGIDHYYIYADIKNGQYSKRVDIGHPIDTTYTADLSPDFTYAIYIVALDAAGNWSDPALLFDNEPPTAPSNLSYSLLEDDLVKFTWDPPTDNSGEIDDYTLTYSFIDSTGVTCYNNKYSKANQYNLKLNKNIEYTITVNATDKSGNKSSYITAITFKIPDAP